jgi:hypothetical protein
MGTASGLAMFIPLAVLLVLLLRAQAGLPPGTLLGAPPFFADTVPNRRFKATGTLVNQHDRPVLVQLTNQQPFQMTLLANFSSQRDLPDTFTYNSYNNSITMFRRPEALDLPTLITYSLPSMNCMRFDLVVCAVG